jgi:hypothetical protein
MKIRRAVPSLLVLLLLAACADAPVGPRDDPGIDHASGRDQLLVRIDNQGGFVPLEWTYRSIPTFSLYGDGTLVVPGAQIAIYPGPALPAISARQIDEAGIQAILEEAIAAVSDVPDDLDDLGAMGIADASTTVITVRAGGVDRTIRVYALFELDGQPDGMPDREYRARERLSRLVNRLTGLDAWLPAGSLGAEDTYAASAARVYARDYEPVEDLAQQPIAWPLDVELRDFGASADPVGFRCGVVEGSDWSALLASAAEANELSPWTDAEARFSLLVRPLLPDENGC